MSLVFISLEGDPPAELGLEPLGSRDKTLAIAASIFLRDDSPMLQVVRDLATPIEPSDGPLVVYCFGHGWTQEGDYITSAVEDGESVVLSGVDLVQRISAWARGPTLLVIDTCHAAAMRPALESAQPHWSVIFGAAEKEAALEIANEGSRLAFALSVAMRQARKKGWADAATLAVYASDYLDRDPLFRNQRVGLWAQGTPFVALVDPSAAGARERAGRRLRLQLVAAGAIAIAVLGWAVEHYRTTVWIEVDVSPAVAALKDGALRVVEQRPGDNSVALLQKRTVDTSVMRFQAPAGDVSVEYAGEFTDERPRAIRVPILAAPGFDWSKKWITIRLPSTDTIRRHPDMALVQGRAWTSGAQLEPAEPLDAFWIDIRPPTVAEFLPVVKSWAERGEIEPHESVLLSAQAVSAGIEAVGARQLTTLVPQLNQILDVVMAERRADVIAPPADPASIARSTMPCAECPALMSHKEARMYCMKRGMRLPSPMEWEYAVRGVDGRRYPFGDKLDTSRMNAPGLPAKGTAAPDLVSVWAHLNSESPFGLIDTVGNAGDWVDAGDENQRQFMGGTYRQNPEDATVFASMPSPEEPVPYLPVTARCVSPL